MGTLFTNILDHQPISPSTLARLPGMKAIGSKIEVSTNLDPRNRWRSLSVIKFTAGQFTSPAAHAFRRICYYEAFRLIHNDEGGFFCTPRLGGGYRYNHDSAYQKKLTP
jgi:hypothetical protein